MDKDKELAISSGLKAGNRQAWLQLYEAYAERVYLYVGRLMGFDRQATEDVVQETFLAAARSAGGFDARRGSLWMWLWGIARRQIALHYRKISAKANPAKVSLSNSGLDGLAGWIDGKSDPPPDILQNRELAGLVRLALSELPAEYQVLLLAKYVDGQATKAIADDLNCSHSAVASKLARAKKALRKEFGKKRIGRQGSPLARQDEVSS